MEKEKKQMGFIGNIINSLSTNNLGFSGRKLTALFSALMGAYITFFKLPIEQQFNALCVWLLLCVLCLGIVTFEQIIKLKNGKNEQP
jgi:amino acid permease